MNASGSRLQTAVLPHNEEAEQGLLSAILANRFALDEVADRLGPDHFYIPVHGRIYRAALELRAAGMAADPVTLRRRFQADGDLAHIGGVEYLQQLAMSIVVASSVGDYARIIIATATRRALIEAAGEIIATASRADDEGDVTALIAEAEQRLFAVGDGCGADSRVGGIGDAVPDIEARCQALVADRGAAPRAPSTGMPDLDHAIGGLAPGRLIVIAGRPGMGKSALAINIAENAARRGTATLLFSLEMSREEILRRMIARSTGIETDRQQAGPISRAEAAGILAAARECARLPILIDDASVQTSATIAAAARRAKRRQGIGLLVVDYLQLMELDGRREDTRATLVGDATRRLKALARGLGICVVLLSQLSRQVEGRDDKRPTPADLRDSGSIEQDADQILFPYRPEFYLREPERRQDEMTEKYAARRAAYEDALMAAEGKADLIIAKNRHGRLGVVKARFDGARQRFDSISSRAGHGGDGE